MGEKEIAWINSHQEEVSALEGKWVAIEGEQLIAAAPELKEVLRVAKGKGIDKPLVFKVPSKRIWVLPEMVSSIAH